MALKKSTYSSVDELPDLLQEKKTDYKSVDELPDLKKKSSGGVNADIGGTVGSSKAPSSVSTDPLQNQKRVFSGLNKAPISTSTPFSTGEVQKSEEKKPDNSIFNPANSVKHDIRELDTQELREYNKRSNAVETKPQVELIGQIKEERKDPAQQKKLALDYIADDMKESATSPIVDQHGLDVPQYFNSRKKEITSEIESINNETAGYRNALRLGEIKQPSPEAEAKIKRKDELTQKLSELNKYSNIYNQERAISDVNPSLSPDEKVIQIGRNLRKVNELDKVKKEESDIYNGVPVDKPEVKSIRDFNDELAGINALRSKTIEDYKSGTIPEDEAKAQLQFLKEKDNTLDEKYPAAAIESIRGLLSEDIANYRKQSNENAPKNSGGNLSYYWNNIVSAAPSKEEIKSSIDRARKSGAKISLDQENELMKDPDKFALTSMLGHLYHGSIVQADQAIFGIDEERQKDFRDASVNQMEQPSELPAINEDGKVRMTANEKAGQKNPMGWGTLNNVAEVGGTIFNYIVANKGIGALSDAVLGGVAGAEVVGYGKGLKEVTKLTEAQKNLASNIGSSVLLNYSHNKEYAKTLTDNESEQDAYAMARSLITGLAFSELNPNKIISGVSASTEKNIAEKFLQQYKAGKGALNPDGMKKWFADVVINTAKDLGHNVTTIKADQLAGIALDRLTNKEAFQNRDVMNEMVGNLPSDVLALVPFSAIAGYKKSSTDIGIRNAVKLAISDPTKFESGMMDKVASGEIKKEDAEQKIGYIKELVKTSGGADMKSERVQALPENDQFKYAVNLAKESNLKSKSENITDKVQLDEHKRDINELTDERKAILNGTHDEYQSNVALFDRAYEKGTHNQTLDAGTKSEGVKYLSEQALTAPNSFKNQTGRDTELTTDLIALNPKEAIREEIKGWGDKIKPDATQAETESIQKHIDLLEAGLQKKSPKKEETPISFQKTEMKRRDIQPIGDNVPTPTEVSGKDVVVDKTEPKTEPITNEKETTQDTNKTKVEGKEQPLVTDPTSKGETGKTEAEVRKAIEEAAASKKSENGKKVAMEEEAAKHGKVGEKVLADISKEAEPPENNDSNENNGNEDWTHINKKDITEAEDLASKHPFGESETWKNSVKKGLDKLAKVAKKGESLYDAAKNKVNEWAAKVKQEILDDGKSTFNPSDEEIAQMAYHRTMTNKRIAELEPDLTSPIQAVRDAAEIVLGDLEAQKQMVDYVLHNTATTAGRAFNIRQMVSKIDSENGLQVKRMDVIRKQKGQPLSEKQEQEIRDIHDEEVKNQKAKDEYAQKKAQQDFEEAVKLEVDRRLKNKKTTKSKDEVKATAKKAGDVIRKLKMPKGGARLDITLGSWDKLVEGVAKLVETGVTIKEAVNRMINDGTIAFKYDKDRDYAIDYMDNANKHNALDSIREISEKEKSAMLTKSAVGKGLVNDLVNHYIDKGLTGKDLFSEMNKDLKEIFPEITEQQVRDAYLKEGEFTLDKKENINKAKVDAKNELRSIAKNETDIADLKAERDLRKREREERQKTNYENQLIAEKKGLTDKKALTEKQEARLIELNKELERIKQRKEKEAKVSNPKDLNRSDKEKAVLDEIKKEKEQWAKEKQAQRDLDVAAKKAQTAAKNEAERLKALTEKRDRLQRGQRDAPATNTPKVESTAIEQVKAEIKEADKKLREAESEANRINKEMQAKKDKLAEHEANIKRAENGLESIKTNRKKSDRQIDTDIADAETRLKKELNKQGLKLEKGSKAEKEQKQKVADSHNERVYKVIESIDTKLQDATLATPEKAALENAKKILEKSKINPDSKLDIFDAVDKAEKNTELARAELANSDKLSDVKREIANSQIQMGRDKLQTEQDILLQRHKDNLQKKINENERRLEAGEYVEKEPARLKTSDAESVRLEIKDRETKNKLNAVGKAAQREAMTKREKVIDTIQSLYVIGLVGRLSTLAKVGVSALTKQPLNTITSQTFGRLGSLVFPKINNALRGEGNEGWRKEKNRYMAHYGALGKEGMAKLISKGKENAQKADEAYINAKDKLEDIANKYGKDSKQYKDFEKGEFKKAEDKQKQALLDNVTNSIYEWIGGNAWGDAAEVFLHSSAKLEQLLGKGEKEMWADKTRKEKIMFVLSTSAATHGVLKNFSARAEFAANFVARLENKMKQGIDISKAEEILKTVNESYIAFQRGKYQEDNAITGGFKAGLEGLQRWAERHPDYKYAADLMAGALKFKNPIVRTPLNIAREAIVEYTIGVPLAIAKYRNSLKDARVDAKQFDLAGQEMKDHMKKFMDNIPADKADFIYRAFRKGGFGLGVMALTAMGGIQFGGFFNRDEKRRKKGDELGINEVEIGGQKLTHLQAKIFEHTSAFFPALLWSNYDRVRDENLKAGHGELGANLDAVMKDFQGMIDQIPIGNEMQNPLQGVQIPLIGPFLTEYAEATDVDANGEQIKRKPKGNPLEKVWQNIEMKIPGLRQNVPVSGKSSNWTEEDLKKPILKTFADKGAAKPDYTPSKISIKYVNGKPTQHLDSQTPEIQGLYIKNHQANYELELSKLSNGAYKVYKKPDGSVHIKGENTDEKGSQYTQFKDLTDEQVQYLEGQITRRATIKTKKQLHFQLDDTEKK